MVSLPLPETCCDEVPTVWLWSGHAAYVGPSLQLDMHSGSVDCFALGLDAPFTVRSGDAVERRARSALIPARTSHQVLAGDGRMMFFYVDPGSAGSGNLVGQMTDRTTTIAFDHRDEPALITACRDAALLDPEILRRSLLGNAEADPIDERIRAAMRILWSRPGDQLSATEIAAAVRLSPSRFLHLFSAHAGTSFRRYRLWARMCHAASALSDGADLTTAAGEAGFASPSHFSDAFRAMFGLSATALLAGQTRIVVQAGD
jgi:AraC-like DNA-binding protein